MKQEGHKITAEKFALSIRLPLKNIAINPYPKDNDNGKPPVDNWLQAASSIKEGARPIMATPITGGNRQIGPSLSLPKRRLRYQSHRTEIPPIRMRMMTSTMISYYRKKHCAWRVWKPTSRELSSRITRRSTLRIRKRRLARRGRIDYAECWNQII